MWKWGTKKKDLLLLTVALYTSDKWAVWNEAEDDGPASCFCRIAALTPCSPRDVFDVLWRQKKPRECCRFSKLNAAAPTHAKRRTRESFIDAEPAIYQLMKRCAVNLLYQRSICLLNHPQSRSKRGAPDWSLLLTCFVRMAPVMKTEAAGGFKRTATRRRRCSPIIISSASGGVFCLLWSFWLFKGADNPNDTGWVAAAASYSHMNFLLESKYINPSKVQQETMPGYLSKYIPRRGHRTLENQ